MNVLHVIPSLAEARGGPSTVARLLAESLAAVGVRVQVAATDDDGPGRLGLPNGLIEWNRGVCYRYFRRNAGFYSPSAGLAAWLDREITGFDAVHIHSLFTYPTTVTAWLAHQRRVPYLVRPLGALRRWGVQTRRPLLKKFSFRAVESRLLRGAAAVHYATNQEREEAAALGVRTRAEVIPNPCTLEKVPRRTGGPPSILFLSRLDPAKGLELLIGAYARLRRSVPEATLVIAGDGDPRYAAELRSLARESGAAPGIRWAGFLRGRAKLDALGQASLFVLPSHSESFGMAAVEAMAAGVPTILTDGAGIAPEAGKAGCALVCACRQDALSDSLTRLVGNPALREELGARGRRFVEQHYSPSAVARRLISLYHDVAIKP